MKNIILSAGSSIRFKKKNFDKPKFLLKVKKSIMLLEAAKSLPKKNEWILIFQEKDLIKYNYLQKIIDRNFKNKKIISLKRKTSGQASSLIKIKNYISENDSIFITSNDMKFDYDKKKFNNLFYQKKNIVFVVQPTNFMIKNPNHFGWVRVNENNQVLKVSIKKQFSNFSKNDKVIIGSFFFNSFKEFEFFYKKLKKKKLKINNEYYIDAVVKEMHFQKKISFIEVNNFLSWGTPKEYEENK